MIPHLRRGVCHLSIVVAALVEGSTGAFAHTLVTPYNLPIPFHDYVYACAATLLLTFGVLAFVTGDTTADGPQPRRGVMLGRILPAVGQAGAVVLLALTIAAGVWGTPSPVANIAPTLFWVGMMLGLTVVTVLVGDVFQIINPWHVLVRLLGVGEQPLLRYPAALAYWPAFVCYLGLELLELMAAPRPVLLALALLAYTMITGVGAALFGSAAWFEKAEFFSVFFRMVGTLAPVAYRRDTVLGRWRAYSRWPLSGTLEHESSDLSLVLFILFMLAATTYDGVWQTSFWTGLYWTNLMHWLHPFWGSDMARAQRLLSPGFLVYQRGGLIVAPFVYLALYMAVMLVMRGLTGGRITTRALALQFAFSLIPIAVVYMIAHSWTSLLTTIPVIPFLLTDPFGIGWNLLGLPRMSADPAPLDMGQVWHMEVALILVGHVASVWLAHRIAQRTLPSQRQAWICELPLLLMMVGYTFLGLAVLSLPLALH